MRTDYPATWFRLYAEFATDPKVQMLSESDQRRYIMLLCLRCSNGDVTLQETEIAFQLRVTDTEWGETKSRLMAKNLIDQDNKPMSWEKRQRASDSSTERVARYRAKHKTTSNDYVTLQKRQVETETETETDKEKKGAPPKTTAAPVPGEPKPMTKKQAMDCLIGLGVTTTVATDWLAVREKKSAKVTQTAIDGIIREAALANMSLNDALKEGCERGWTAFKASWIERDRAHQPKNGKPSPHTLPKPGTGAYGEGTPPPTPEQMKEVLHDLGQLS